jgi:hypothetical protein
MRFAILIYNNLRTLPSLNLMRQDSNATQNTSVVPLLGKDDYGCDHVVENKCADHR